MKVKQQTMLKTNENGRSMVEMLGVLAIIGVLSVAGIAGYSMAMKKYKANEIIATASTFYALAEAGNLSGNLAGASYGVNGEEGLEKAGMSKPFGTVDMSYDYDNQEITITGVGDDDICKTVKDAFTDGRLGFTVPTCS